jgi:hypothetical protein
LNTYRKYATLSYENGPDGNTRNYNYFQQLDQAQIKNQSDACVQIETARMRETHSTHPETDLPTSSRKQ